MDDQKIITALKPHWVKRAQKYSGRDATEFREFVGEAIIIFKVNLADIAEKTDSTPEEVNNWATGKTVPSEEERQRITQSLADLIKDKPQV